VSSIFETKAGYHCEDEADPKNPKHPQRKIASICIFCSPIPVAFQLVVGAVVRPSTEFFRTALCPFKIPRCCCVPRLCVFFYSSVASQLSGCPVKEQIMMLSARLSMRSFCNVIATKHTPPKRLPGITGRYAGAVFTAASKVRFDSKKNNILKDNFSILNV
jgi:hypothetical protein